MSLRKTHEQARKHSVLTRTWHADDVGDATDSTKWDDGSYSGLLCQASAHQDNGMRSAMMTA